jgi:hypothetical protein
VAGSNAPEGSAGTSAAEGLGQWNIVQTDLSPQEQLDQLVMAWAKDAQTGEPRYILELDEQHKGAKCGCICYSCGLPLTAVNAGKKLFVIRPHFRHPDGAEKKDCMVLTARAAAIAALNSGERIHLPAKRFGAHVIGLSGERYDAWVTKPRELVHIRHVRLRDQVNAMLTLDDGREVLVRLTGTAGAGDSNESCPVIQLEVNDPRLASLDLKELKSRLHLLVETAQWCGPHWDEEEQTKLALAQAQFDAENRLDSLWPDATAEIGDRPTRETFLHWLAKEILLREKRLMVPPLVFQGESRGRPFAVKSEALLQLTDVRLEQGLGGIRPDVLARYVDPDNGEARELLIEVTVTNPLTPERVSRIASQGLAALEINLRSLGGALTEQAFAKLLVDELTAKQWIHHPWTATQAQEESDSQARQSALRSEAEHTLAEGYLSAVEQYAEHLALDTRTLSWEVQLDRKARDVEPYAKALVSKGYATALADELYRNGSILQRLLSIRESKPIGYRLDLWGVFNAIRCDVSAKSKVWHTLYLIAHKVYAPKLAKDHEAKIQELRQLVLDSLQAGESTYRRPRRHDALLGLLFPEMRESLSRPLPGDERATSSSQKPASFQSSAPPRLSQSSMPTIYGAANRLWKEQEPVWLKGAAYDSWKKANPEAAKSWEAAKRADVSGDKE